MSTSNSRRVRSYFQLFLLTALAIIVPNVFVLPRSGLTELLGDSDQTIALFLAAGVVGGNNGTSTTRSQETTNELSFVAVVGHGDGDGNGDSDKQRSLRSNNDNKDASNKDGKNGSCSKARPSSRSRKVFNPFVDLKVERRRRQEPKEEQENKKRNPRGGGGGGGGERIMYSSIRCVGTGASEENQREQESQNNFRANFISRTCMYHNLYYRPADKTFHYWASPEEETARRESKIADRDGSAAEMIQRKQVAIGTVIETADPAYKTNSKRNQNVRNIRPWEPIWHPSDTSDFMDDDDQGRGGRVAVFSETKKKLTFLLYHAFHSFKISHFVWDDLMGMFSMMDAFLVQSDDQDDDNRLLWNSIQPVPLFVELRPGADGLYRCNTANPHKWNQCVRVYRKFFPLFFGIATDPCGTGDILRTGNFLLGPQAIGVWREKGKVWKSHGNGTQSCTNAGNRNYNRLPDNTDYVLLPSVIAGDARSGLFGCAGDCMIHRQHQFYRFRRFLRTNLNLEPEAEEEQEQESLSSKPPPCDSSNNNNNNNNNNNKDPRQSSQLWKKRHPRRRRRPAGYMTFSLPAGSTRRDKVSWFEAEIAWARQTYGNATVRVVDLATVPMVEQADLLANTAVFVTNHGGGSFSTIFLSRGSSAVIFHDGTKRRDFQFHEAAGYYQSTWIKKGMEGKFINYTTAVLAHEYQRTLQFWDEYYYPNNAEDEDNKDSAAAAGAAS